MTTRFELYGYWRTSATYRVRVALRLKGLAADEVTVDLDAGEQKSAAFRKVNPMAAVPALVDREGSQPGQAITQSLAILDYLDEVAPAPPLLPADPFGRARVRSLALMMAADLHPLLPSRVKEYATVQAGLDAQAWRAWQTHWFTTGLQALEARLSAEEATGTFCHGDTVSTADICLASIVVVMRLFAIDVEAIPTVRRIMAACEALDAFAASDPRRQVGAPAA